MSKPGGWDRKKAEALWLDGKSGALIAQIVGAPSRSAIVGWMNRNGVKRPEAARPVRPVKAPKPPKAAKAPTVYSWGKGSAAETKAPDLETLRKAEETSVDPATLKTFRELDRQECLWPIGAPDPARGQLFCGQPTAFRKSYCACHGGPQAAPRRPYRVKDLGLAAERPPVRAFAVETDVVDLVEAFR